MADYVSGDPNKKRKLTAKDAEIQAEFIKSTVASLNSPSLTAVQPVGAYPRISRMVTNQYIGNPAVNPKPAGFGGFATGSSAKPAGFVATSGATPKPPSFGPKKNTGLLVNINPVAPSKRVLETAADEGPMIAQGPDSAQWPSAEGAALAAHGALLREQMMAAVQAQIIPRDQSAASSTMPLVTSSDTFSETIHHNSVIEEFIHANGIAVQIANTLRQSHWAVQNYVLRKGFRSDTQNPSGVVLTRIKEAVEHFTLLNDHIISHGIDGETVQVLMESTIGVQKGVMRLQYTDSAAILDYIQQCKVLAASVEEWITSQGIDPDAAGTFRDCDPAVQRDIIYNNSRLKFSNNPNGALVGRIKKAEELLKGGVIK
eukprot:gnl/MRDRNA2_/MRDRNA2_34372_c0_seq1.p1 gnl/MRDRNA2_/MRDRNA2_34372_c0~~gnl/MRDRNA2_/MRDRNA2_34372_c0_seq1.p1  ORF type:complete len:372 (-),score=79.14 gnl/MRDRNA2_/MRDRNA2_34372_c0_seq1:177-1292(-)